MGRVDIAQVEPERYYALLDQVAGLLGAPCIGVVLFDRLEPVICPRPGMELLLFGMLARIDWDRAVGLAAEHDQSGLT